MGKHKVLILGGTVEARLLAASLVDMERYHVVTSLAGRTRDPRLPEGEVRIGGFGGAAGLEDYILTESISAIIDATHPFAVEISKNGLAAAENQKIPLLGLSRPAWQAIQGDQWYSAATMADAVAMVPDLAKRAFLTVGVQEVGLFLGAGHDLDYVVRLVEPRDLPYPLERATVIVQKPPFHVDAELTLCQEHAIDLVITKNSGGTATYGKIQAARQLGLPVLMIERPELPQRDMAETIPEALNWLEDQLA